MKKVLIMILMLAPLAAMAQKFGHVNSQEVIQAMPEYTKAKTEIDALQQQYDLPDEKMLDALLVASAVGVVVAENSGISGAAGGCQAEVGTASAMAAAAAV